MDDFNLLIRKHELAIDKIKERWSAMIMVNDVYFKKEIIDLFSKRLKEFFESERVFYLEIITELKKEYESLEKYKDDKNLYSAYKKNIENFRNSCFSILEKRSKQLEKDIQIFFDRFIKIKE